MRRQDIIVLATPLFPKTLLAAYQPSWSHHISSYFLWRINYKILHKTFRAYLSRESFLQIYQFYILCTTFEVPPGGDPGGFRSRGLRRDRPALSQLSYRAKR